VQNTEVAGWIEKVGQRWRLALVVLASAGLLLYFLIGRAHRAQYAAANTSPAMKQPVVPVAAIAAKQGDLKQYISAIGSVTPYNTVMVKSRVDGQLEKVNFTEGQIVKAGDLLAQIDPRPFQVQLAQAEGTAAKDRASLVNAKTLLARDQTLFNQQIIAAQDLDNQKASVGQFEGALAADQGVVANAQLQLTYSKITSPITGRVGLRLVDAGNIVRATDPQGLAVITQLQPIAVVFSIPEDDLPLVQSALKASGQLPVEAYDRDLKRKLASGTLLTTDNEIDQTTGTIKLKAAFPNDDNALFPNQFVNAKLLVNTIPNAILIPAAALQRSQQGNFVYIVKPDHTVEMRMVKVGATQGDLVAIDSNLKTGELVAVDGLDKLQQGSHVNVQMAANPPTGKTP
jgi:multidrug efflux system membrane fusion protein